MGLVNLETSVRHLMRCQAGSQGEVSRAGGAVWARDPSGSSKAGQQGREHGQRKGKGELLALPPQVTAARRMDRSVAFVEPNYVSGPKELLRIPGRV